MVGGVPRGVDETKRGSLYTQQIPIRYRFQFNAWREQEHLIIFLIRNN
jgi:hypothetical protein